MSVIDKLKRKTTDQNQEDMENWLMKQPVGDLMDYMTYKLIKTEKPVQMIIMYRDVKFTITCEGIDATEFEETLKEKIKEL